MQWIEKYDVGHLSIYNVEQIGGVHLSACRYAVQSRQWLEIDRRSRLPRHVLAHQSVKAIPFFNFIVSFSKWMKIKY